MKLVVPLDPAHPARETEIYIPHDRRHAMLLRALGAQQSLVLGAEEIPAQQRDLVAGALGDLYWKFFEGELRPDAGVSDLAGLLAGSQDAQGGSRIRDALEKFRQEYPKEAATFERFVRATRYSIFRSAAGWQQFAATFAPYLLRELPPSPGNGGDGGDGSGDGDGGAQGDDALAQAMAEALAKTIQDGGNDVAAAIVQAGQGEDNAKDLAKAMGAGDEDVMRQVDMNLIRRLANHHVARAIRLGREISARLNLAGMGRDNRGVRGRVQGTRNILALLPHELARLSPNAPDIVRARQIRRLHMGQTLGLDMSPGNADGPVLFVLDESGSMNAVRYHAKGLFLALAQAVWEEDRAVGYVGFSYRARGTRIESIRDLAEAVGSWYGGGTRLAAALAKAQRLLAQDEFDNADLVIITDAELDADDAQVSVEMVSALAARGVRVAMLVIGVDETANLFAAIPGVRVARLPGGVGVDAFVQAAVEVAARVFDEVVEG